MKTTFLGYSLDLLEAGPSSACLSHILFFSPAVTPLNAVVMLIRELISSPDEFKTCTFSSSFDEAALFPKDAKRYSTRSGQFEDKHKLLLLKY